MLHLALDYSTHSEDAWLPLWPMTSRRWRAPVSYWEVERHARLLAAVDAIGLLVFGGARRRPSTLLAALPAAAMVVRLSRTPKLPLGVAPFRQ